MKAKCHYLLHVFQKKKVNFFVSFFLSCENICFLRIQKHNTFDIILFFLYLFFLVEIFIFQEMRKMSSLVLLLGMKKGCGRSKLYETCAVNHWKPPVFECCKEEGPCHCIM